MFESLPNILTVLRIIAILPMVVFVFIAAEFEAVWAFWVAMMFFVAASITDFLDGYLARKHNLVSPIGRMLDPIADKMLVVSALLMIAAFGLVDAWSILAIFIIMMREIIVSGIRESLGAYQITMPVTKLAKWKTGVQMTAIGFLLVGDKGAAIVPDILGLHLSLFPVTLIGTILLWAAAAITAITGYGYFSTAMGNIDAMKEKDKSKT